MASRLAWISDLNIDLEPTAKRRTGIVCTVGPSTNSVEKINELRAAGVNIVRMNFSHGSYEYHSSVVANARESQRTFLPELPIGIALDTKGPEIRTGIMENNQDIDIQTGHQMIFTTDDEYAERCNGERLYIDYKSLPKVIESGKIIYIDDGALSFEVIEVLDTEVEVRALNNGTLRSRKGVNLPRTDVDLPALSEKDKADIRFGVEHGVDIIFASFIRCAQDIREIRAELGKAAEEIKIIAKIENYQGVYNFPDILSEADGVMIARGDLGIEIPCERVFIAQKSIIAQCNLAGKSVVCATQMLESMTYNPRPTRAEISDVANAVLDGVDCVMLSGETAKGLYPVEAVKTMAEACQLAESVLCYPQIFNELRGLTKIPTDITETIASSAVNASLEADAGAIIVLTHSGNTARLISKYRPHCPIITVTRNGYVARQAHLHSGCYPFLYPKPATTSTDEKEWLEDVDARIEFAIEQGIKAKLVGIGQPVVVVQGYKEGLGNTNSMRVIIT
ncbi:pyruvate kinase [Basidiobolus meristosporus CBS 931.73]|uniref:Pyruvate kinase n=1 Tax=Basidiobolus meristosporus CBS 931.73 TaxID=1314790 RepID=A0A1Y1Y0N3_9FUNG|nr:pyruvate kinase [Basidiobolus meristosporus CBS 931.73]|eukprot:ORX91572.1 pyruvate kinase [Basidiobolus meristosporus CBS 931.73]